MAYKPVEWINNVTPLNAANLNYMDQAIKSAHDQLEWINEERLGDLGELSVEECFDNLSTSVDARFEERDQLFNEFKTDVNDQIDKLEESANKLEQISHIQIKFDSNAGSLQVRTV